MKIAAVGVTRESTVAPPHLAQSLNPKAGGHANPPAPADGRRHCADIRSPGVGLDYLSMTDKYLSSLDMKDCRYSILTYPQVQRLSNLMNETIPIQGRGNFPTLEVKLVGLVVLVKSKLETAGIPVKDIRLNGSVASSVLAVEMSNIEYNDLDLIFSVDLTSQRQYELVKQVVLDALLDLLPEGTSKERMSGATLKEAYVSKMVKVTDVDRWSLIALGNNRIKSVELKFVDEMKRKYEFSVDSFHIILDTLFLFYECSNMCMSENFYPTVVGESVYGDFSEALGHLENRLIATKHPEQIRGGGLLKYCNLLVKNYRPAIPQQVKNMERYMCSRFFIDFPDLGQQRTKLVKFLDNHFLGNDAQLKYDYLTILYQVVNESTVCLMGHERRLTLALIEALSCNVISPYSEPPPGSQHHSDVISPYSEAPPSGPPPPPLQTSISNSNWSNLNNGSSASSSSTCSSSSSSQMSVGGGSSCSGSGSSSSSRSSPAPPGSFSGSSSSYPSPSPSTGYPSPVAAAGSCSISYPSPVLTPPNSSSATSSNPSNYSNKNNNNHYHTAYVTISTPPTNNHHQGTATSSAGAAVSTVQYTPPSLSPNLTSSQEQHHQTSPPQEWRMVPISWVAITTPATVTSGPPPPSHHPPPPSQSHLQCPPPTTTTTMVVDNSNSTGCQSSNVAYAGVPVRSIACPPPGPPPQQAASPPGHQVGGGQQVMNCVPAAKYEILTTCQPTQVLYSCNGNYYPVYLKSSPSPQADTTSQNNAVAAATLAGPPPCMTCACSCQAASIQWTIAPNPTT